VRGWDQETRVHIRWPWIILPTCLLIFSCLFLAITILRSEKDDKIRIWKSSTLAVLFNGLGEDVQNSMGAGSNLREGESES
jgi:heme/copper-type cytochrome/quinol oxidase subunit 3